MRWFDEQITGSTEEKLAISELDKFLKEEVEPHIASFEKAGEFPISIVNRMGKELGLFGLTIPEEYEGTGFGTRMASLIARKIAYVSGGLHLIWTANSSLAAFPIVHAGSEKQKRELLPLLASGKKMGCFGLTEPEAGSDAASLRMRAEKVGDCWVLNGTKTYITNALHASIGIFFARTGDKKHDISAFIIESDAPGFADIPGLTVNKIEKHILACSDFCEMIFDDVAVRPRNGGLLGELNKGFPIAMATLDGGRINIAAQSIGIASRIVDEAYEYVHERRQFGKSLWENQSKQFDFADWYTKLLCAWFAVDWASCFRDEGSVSITPISSAVKLRATETAYEVASRAVRCFGGMAVTKDMDIFMRMLETCTTTIYEGTSEMQKTVFIKYL